MCIRDRSTQSTWVVASATVIGNDPKTLEKILTRSNGTYNASLKRISVKYLSGKTFSLNVSGSLTVEDLKYMIHDCEGILPDRQRLIFASKELDNSQTLADCNVQNGSTFHLIAMVLGSGVQLKIFRRDTRKLYTLLVSGGMKCIEFKTAVSELTGIALSELVIRPDIFNIDDKHMSHLHVKDLDVVVFPRNEVLLTNLSQLTRLAMLQDSEGLWRDEHAILHLGGFEVPALPEDLVAKLGAQAKSVWLTIHIINTLKGSFSQQKRKWCLIVAKSELFLESLGISVSQYSASPNSSKPNE
eukprot:TRINITY_DN11946_c0_g1_i4.p1 TRINITY_DN11946_c0_g1~~TRINITY_DN11946_c0_g1_i4.p1  ORF type:complete len:300 (+),score=42.79 TRINITY_DN11946_c0_g1_i4:65-964(+)